jgi:hypothetical protein
MARVCALSVAPDGVHLKEPHAQAFLGAADNDVKHLDGCYLDTGATNHMTCHVEVFSDLDQSMVGSVNFGDSSVVRIQGRGSIAFTGKRGGHKVLTGVYYISQLRNSIVSLGQLDENDTMIHIDDGVLRIWVLNLDVTRPIWLTARHDNDTWPRWFGASPSTHCGAYPRR